MPEDKPDPYWYAREHDGDGWSVRGIDGTVIKGIVDAAGNRVPLDKNVAYCIAKLLSGKPDDALKLLIEMRYLFPT